MNVPGYTVQEELLSGPGWRLLRAIRTSDASRMLLKISVDDRTNQDAASLLLGEYALTRQHDSGYILAVKDILRFKDQVVLVYENFTGIPLSRFLESGPLPVHELLQLASGLCEALKAIHHKGFVHGFLHPVSLLVERRLMRLKITNFFLTQPTGLPGTLPSAIGTIPGIVSYIAPEQSGRIERTVDHRSDLYTFGTVMYHALTGWPPFRGNDAIEIIYAHLARVPLPPHQIDPQVPEALSRIVMTLLAKEPSDRYQSATLLRDDIQRCQDELAAHGHIGELVLRTGTDNGRFELPLQLVGRDAEMRRLITAYDKCCEGSMSVLLIDGYAGIGKSALVQSLLPIFLRKNGSFIRGKADQMQRDIPYAALSSAIRDFVNQLLMESRSRLEYWQTRFHDYLHPVAGIVTGLVPEMEFFLDARHEVENVPQSEARNRFKEVMRRVFDALASKDHPLVFFLDDLQWVDNETLQLLASILEENTKRHLLFIGALRKHELENTHAAVDFLNLIERMQGYEGTIILSALTLDQVNTLVSAAMHCSPSQSIGLSQILYEKTRGNPFFLKQFLSIVHENGLLVYDADSCHWRWDAERIEHVPSTENVVLLLTQRIQTWPEQSREILSVASCLGNSFALSTIAAVADKNAERIREELTPALEARLLLEVDRGQEAILRLPERNGKETVFQFLHDRVQQAAYTRITPEQLPAVHLNIARRLVMSLEETERERYAFMLADQFNAGRALIEDVSERRMLARLNFAAGMKASSSVAFTSAVTYFRVALELLDQQWDEEFELLWEITKHIGRAEYALGNHSSALASFSTLLEHARTAIESAEALAEKVHLMIHVGRYDEALRIGRRGLSLLGYPVPSRIHRANVLLELLRLRFATLGTTPEAMSRRPAMTDVKARMALDLMTRLLTAAYFASSETIGFFILRMMRIVVKHGMIDSAAHVFSQYGLVLGAGLGRHEEALRYAITSVQMIEGTPYPYWKTRVYLTIAAVVNHWTKDARESLDYLRIAREAARECGDPLYGLYSRQFTVITRFFLGDPVGDMLEVVEPTILYAKENDFAFHSMVCYRQTLLDCKGDTINAGEWASSDVDEQEIRTAIEQSGDIASIVNLYILRMLSCFLADRLDEAASMRALALRNIEGSMGQLLFVQYHYYAALIASERMFSGNDLRAERRVLRKSYRKLGSFARRCAINFSAQADHLEAEACAVGNDRQRSLRLYDQALAASSSRKDALTEAIIARCAARRCRAWGLTSATHAYATRAVHAFNVWGAMRYADACFVEFLEEHETAGDQDTSSYIAPKLRSNALPHTAFDLGSLLKAAAAISAVIHLPDLIDRLLRIMVENAGAEQGVLFLELDGDLRTVARRRSDLPETIHYDELPVDETPDIPRRIIRYVQRTHTQVLLDSAITEEQFSIDADVARRNVLSVLCMPIMYKSSLIGVAYLENNLAQGVFHSGRINFLELLSSQIATALENAKLYTRLEEARTALERYSHDLEKKVQERTHDLEQRGNELQQTLNELQRTQAQLIQSEKMASLGELTAGIAHEIQNPLNFIQNFSELCIELTSELLTACNSGNIVEKSTWRNDLGSLRDVSGKIHEHGQRIERIVRGMLAHSRTGSQTRAPAQINTLLSEALTLSYRGFRARNESCSVAIETSYDEHIPQINCIAADITRVFLNIMGNALYFMKLKTLASDSSYLPILSVVSECTDTHVVIRIRDNGPGIAEETLTRVFQPFFTTKPTGDGTGLGLSIGYTIIVEGHGGVLSVASKHGDWSEFTIRLPLA